VRVRREQGRIATAAIARVVLGLSLAAGLHVASHGSPAPAPVAKLSGCYQVTLTRTAPSATDADGNSLHRTVVFLAELSTAKFAGAADDYAVLENRSTGRGRLFERAHWRVEKNQSVRVVFSDDHEEWSATLKPSGKRLSGTATYTGDVDHPERHWLATASRYTCKS